MLREVRCLAKLKNQHVVGYNHTWIEVDRNRVVARERERCSKALGRNRCYSVDEQDCESELESEEEEFVLDHKGRALDEDDIVFEYPSEGSKGAEEAKLNEWREEELSFEFELQFDDAPSHKASPRASPSF